ncbi:MAG TPA: hypothetical protein DHV42_04285 [Lachnospiraceae bacterium]|nr:hypothetical protein [Lachnospiraceae bacterium]
MNAPAAYRLPGHQSIQGSFSCLKKFIIDGKHVLLMKDPIDDDGVTTVPDIKLAIAAIAEQNLNLIE